MASKAKFPLFGELIVALLHPKEVMSSFSLFLAALLVTHTERRNCIRIIQKLFIITPEVVLILSLCHVAHFRTGINTKYVRAHTAAGT